MHKQIQALKIGNVFEQAKKEKKKALSLGIYWLR